MSRTQKNPKGLSLDTWVDRSLRQPVYFERSAMEMEAEARLIREKAKTEWWNRSLSKFYFGVGLGLPVFVAGILLGIFLSAG